MEERGSAVNDWDWQDITTEFRSSVEQLQLGELLKSDHFTLLDAMSSLELMDPRMDSGMALKKSNRKILTLEQSIKAGKVKVNNLRFDELIGIIDETYTGLTTWLESYSIAQSLMTNLYLHDTEKLEDRCLKIFSQSILKIADFLNSLVQWVHCIEEEDFLFNFGPFNLASQVNSQKLQNSLEDLCQCYEKKLLELRQQQPDSSCSAITDNNNKQPTESTENSDSDFENQEKSQLIALISRLRFTYYFYSCLSTVYKNLLKNQSDTDTDAQLMKTIKLVQTIAINSNQNIDKCLKNLEKWKETIDLGIKPHPATSEQASESDYSTIMGFDPMINHKILAPSYPRFSIMKTRPETVECLKTLVIRLKECYSISGSFTQKSFNKSMESIENFSKYYRYGSCVVSRSLLQTLYYPNRSIKLFKDELLQSMIEFCEPLVQQMKKDEDKLGALNEFLAECSHPFLNLIGIYGHNAARQNEKIPELILTFKNLQYSALLINSLFNNIVLYSWTTLQLARLCIKYIMSGLELELYSTHEYPYVFWYLYEILYRNEKEQIELARQYIHDNRLALEVDSQKKIKGNKKQRKKNLPSTSYHDRSLACNEAYRFLTGGIFLLTYGLKLQGKIKTPLVISKETNKHQSQDTIEKTANDYTTEEICFDHRFGLLTGTSVYQAYKSTLNRLEKLEYIYREAFDCFFEAKRLFEAIGGHEGCLKVCKTNMVVAKILTTNLSSFDDREFEFCFETHPSFPTLKV